MKSLFSKIEVLEFDTILVALLASLLSLLSNTMQSYEKKEKEAEICITKENPWCIFMKI